MKIVPCNKMERTFIREYGEPLKKSITAHNWRQASSRQVIVAPVELWFMSCFYRLRRSKKWLQGRRGSGYGQSRSRRMKPRKSTRNEAPSTGLLEEPSLNVAGGR